MSRRSPLLVLRVVQMESQGLDRNAISAETGISLSVLGVMLSSPIADRIRKEIESRTIDTIAEVQTDAQAAAPNMFKVLQDIALDDNEKATNRIIAAKTVLEMAGHKPIQTLELRKGNPLESDYHGKTEDEIRKEIYEGLDDGGVKGLPEPSKSVH
jgi:hypothetical protein